MCRYQEVGVSIHINGGKMKLLPFPEKPIFLCYHNLAFPFEIIEANSPEDVKKWVCTKCVNCAYYPNSPKNKFNIAA